jgi:hypothetical protein
MDGRDASGFGGAPFQNGKKRGIPPMFFRECASGCESRGWRSAENECVQAIERERVRREGFSKRRDEFTDECSVFRSTCQ